MTTIQDLRDELFEIKQEISTCDKSIANAKEDAQTLLREQDNDGLIAVNERYLSLLQQRKDRAGELAMASQVIEQHYQAVARGEATIDFDLSLVQGENWCGWSSMYKPGWVIKISRHLPEEELAAIRIVCEMSSLFTRANTTWAKTSERPFICLKSHYYAYRDTCQSDRSGQWLWKKLTPILHKEQAELAINIANLAVLRA